MSLKGLVPPSNYQSLDNFSKMLLVISQSFNCLKGLESLKGLGPLSNNLSFAILIYMFLFRLNVTCQKSYFFVPRVCIVWRVWGVWRVSDPYPTTSTYIICQKLFLWGSRGFGEFIEFDEFEGFATPIQLTIVRYFF